MKRALWLLLLVSAACAAPSRAVRVTEALVPPVRVKGADEQRWSIDERMKRYRVPGVSIAVFDEGKLAWARGFGVAEQGRPDAVTADTLFQAGSISKPVTATATLRMAELGQVSLDADVNQYLRSWKVPENDFTATEKVTLRRIMSHQAGLNLHGFPGYAAGEALPTVPQILEGAPPANTAPIRVGFVPGSQLSYSGGGATIEQLVLMDVTGKSFPALLKELVLAPAGMRLSTFELSPAGATSAAHDVSGAVLKGRVFAYPESAAAGLWSTPSELLAWASAVASSRVLSPASSAAMLTRVKGPLGLGPILRGEGAAFRFGHPGTVEGFHAEVVFFPALGKGAAVMVNGYGGRPLIGEVLGAIAAEYGWPGYTPETIEPIEVVAQTRELLAGRYAGKFERVPVLAEVRSEGEKLVFACERLGLESELVFTSKAGFVLLDSGDPLTFTRGDDGAVTAVSFGDIVLSRAR